MSIFIFYVALVGVLKFFSTSENFLLQSYNIFLVANEVGVVTSPRLLIKPRYTIIYGYNCSLLFWNLFIF